MRLITEIQTMFRGFFSTISNLALLASAARYPSFGTLHTTKASGVLNVVINNTYSPINLFDLHVQSDLANLIETLQANDTDIRVVVFSSANPDFFLAHLDVNFFLPGYGAPLLSTSEIMIDIEDRVSLAGIRPWTAGHVVSSRCSLEYHAATPGNYRSH